jgi:hypothetical protein
MGARAAEASDATAFRLLTALERYEDAIDEMLVHWPDMLGYSSASVQIDEVRLHSASLPPTSVAFVALLIARTELFECLFAAANTADHEGITQCSREHAVAIAGLRRKCTHLLAIRH